MGSQKVVHSRVTVLMDCDSCSLHLLTATGSPLQASTVACTPGRRLRDPRRAHAQPRRLRCLWVWIRPCLQFLARTAILSNSCSLHLCTCMVLGAFGYCFSLQSTCKLGKNAVTGQYIDHNSDPSPHLTPPELAKPVPRVSDHRTLKDLESSH